MKKLGLVALGVLIPLILAAVPARLRTISANCSAGLSGPCYASFFTTPTTDTTATPGNASASTARGRSAIANGTATVTITNPLMSTTSTLKVTPWDTANDVSNMRQFKVTSQNGSFGVNINSNAGVAAGWRFDWEIMP